MFDHASWFFLFIYIQLQISQTIGIIKKNFCDQKSTLIINSLKWPSSCDGWLYIKFILMVTSIKQATCIKQACIHFTNMANALKCTCI